MINQTPDEHVRGFSLVSTDEGALGLQAEHRPEWKPVSADWLSSEMKRRISGGRKQLLSRAVGLRAKPEARILDVTGGLGRDAFTLAALGANITLLERQPMVVALLRDAQQRARNCTDAAMELSADRVCIIGTDAIDFDVPPDEYDAIYMDPMYPSHGRRSLPQKEMQLLRELAGDDIDADELLRYLLPKAPRIAVKRPAKAPCLAGIEPDVVLRGTQARYDIYLQRKVPE